MWDRKLISNRKLTGMGMSRGRATRGAVKPQEEEYDIPPVFRD